MSVSISNSEISDNLSLANSHQAKSQYKSTQNFGALFSEELLEIVNNSDGSAEIKFPGGGRHVVWGGVGGPEAALRVAYGARILNSATSVTVPDAQNMENGSISPSGYLRSFDQAIDQPKLTIKQNDDGSAEINFPGGGKHRVWGGVGGPVKALIEAYGKRINQNIELHI